MTTATTTATTARPIEKIFEPDEMTLGHVQEGWTVDTILAQECIFFLKELAPHLGFDVQKVKRAYRDMEASGQNPWEHMGVGKTWNKWIVRMTVFSNYYRRFLVSKAKKIPEGMDGNTLLQQKGVYFLTDVCQHIPFSTHQIRYQAKKNPRAKAEYGVWKDPDVELFLVDMGKFSKWVKTLWEGKY